MLSAEALYDPVFELLHSEERRDAAEMVQNKRGSTKILRSGCTVDQQRRLRQEDL